MACRNLPAPGFGACNDCEERGRQMRVMRFNERSLFGAIAALGVAAMLAGPALAGGSGPDPRTGNIHDDCNQFSLQEDGDKLLLKAKCRTSDSNTDKKETSIDLAASIGNDNGYLKWNQSLFHKSCDTLSLSPHTQGVLLWASCTYLLQQYHKQKRRTKMELGDRYRTDSSGDLAIR